MPIACASATFTGALAFVCQTSGVAQGSGVGVGVGVGFGVGVGVGSGVGDDETTSVTSMKSILAEPPLGVVSLMKPSPTVNCCVASIQRCWRVAFPLIIRTPLA